MSVGITKQHIALAEKLVSQTRSNRGLAPLDVKRFWADQETALNDPWAKDCPQTPLGMLMSRECLFAELGAPEDWHKLIHDEDYALNLVKSYNDLAQQIVGRRILSENRKNPQRQMPAPKGLHDVFEAKNIWKEQSYWLEQSASTEDDLKALLDRVEKRLENLRAFMLPPEWEQAKAKALATGGVMPLYRSQRGPVTFAMSVFGLENLIFLIIENPDLAGRFRDLIIRAILGLARVLDEEAGATARERRGWYWNDDNSAMLTEEMYEFFGYPILKAVFEQYSPNPGDMRGQHSDSDMGHLLPILGRLKLTTVNFGPNIMVADIRRHLPGAVIHGQLAPFTLSRNEEINIVAEFLRDHEMAVQAKGLVFATAGSINNGSRLTSMRLIMAAIQKCGRY